VWRTIVEGQPALDEGGSCGGRSSREALNHLGREGGREPPPVIAPLVSLRGKQVSAKRQLRHSLLQSFAPVALAVVHEHPPNGERIADDRYPAHHGPGEDDRLLEMGFGQRCDRVLPQDADNFSGPGDFASGRGAGGRKRSRICKLSLVLGRRRSSYETRKRAREQDAIRRSRRPE
jgi:hypothetical protein